MASRQERRKAERTAAKAGAAGAATARTTVKVTPLGDWTTQSENPELLFDALGDAIVKKMAAKGDPEAQFSLGYTLISEAGVAGTPLGTDRSPQGDVGLALCTNTFPAAHQTDQVVESGHMTTKDWIAGDPRWRRAWRFWRRRQGKGTRTLWQGLTLVHFSAQPKPLWSYLPVSPCLIDWGQSCTQRIPQNVLTLSRNVDECKPLRYVPTGAYSPRARGVRPGCAVVHQGGPVQVQPTKPMLKAPGSWN